MRTKEEPGRGARAAGGEGERAAGIGGLVRDWRRRRNLTQHALAAQAEVSTRYLSFIETGRARPSRAMVSRLAETLAVPLGGRNQMLIAAGYAPLFGERSLDDPELKPVRHALGRILASHEPYPAFLVDRRWDIRATNRGAGLLTAAVGERALKPAPNLMRMLLHPAGLAGRIRETEQQVWSLLGRVRRRAEQTCDERLGDLHEEILGYLEVRPERGGPPGDGEPLALHRLRAAAGAEELSFFSSVVTFAEARDATVADLSVEAFFPADEATRLALTRPRDGRADRCPVTRQVNVRM
ncbi:MAG: helix-turn-helix transcriptional regulator [Actinobacteria bacterium]|nr:helix-turn-helix transcriptional regulator [Actinomycetota bacterium]